jgi:hypothetical protein
MQVLKGAAGPLVQIESHYEALGGLDMLAASSGARPFHPQNSLAPGDPSVITSHHRWITADHW